MQLPPSLISIEWIAVRQCRDERWYVDCGGYQDGAGYITVRTVHCDSNRAHVDCASPVKTNQLYGLRLFQAA